MLHAHMCTVAGQYYYGWNSMAILFVKSMHCTARQLYVSHYWFTFLTCSSLFFSSQYFMASCSLRFSSSYCLSACEGWASIRIRCKTRQTCTCIKVNWSSRGTQMYITCNSQWPKQSVLQFIVYACTCNMILWTWRWALIKAQLTQGRA